MAMVKAPAERPRGILAPGLAACAVFCVCHQIAGRPRAWVKTNWERDRDGRSSTRSMACTPAPAEEDRHVLKLFRRPIPTSRILSTEESAGAWPAFASL